MGHRVIGGLQWAVPCARPKCFGKARPRGVKKQGLLYEKALAAELGSSWTHGQWFEFEDLNGHGYCQVDFLRQASDATVVLEAKLTWLAEAHQQISQLYAPVLECCWGRRVIGVVVAKRLIPGMTAAIAQNLPSALEAARYAKHVALHWSGKASLYPGPREGASRNLPLSTVSSHSTLQ